MVKKIKDENLGEGIETSKTSKDEVSIYDANGNYIRTYSLEHDGKDYEELAKGFVSKVAGRTGK